LINNRGRRPSLLPPTRAPRIGLDVAGQVCAKIAEIMRP
jgi:hypothetical protein